jgi:excisionase family DNA binding protein
MPELLTIKQAADFLQVTPHCIYRGIKAGRIPYLKISKRLIRIPATALVAGITQEPQEDGKNEAE